MTTLKHRETFEAPVSSDLMHSSPARTRAAHYALGALRIVIGWTFLWAFFDKLLALGYSTGRDTDTGCLPGCGGG